MVIGEVAEGLDVLKKLGALYLDGNGRPWEDVRIQHTHVLENPFAAVECPPSPDRKPETPHTEEKVTARVAYGQAKDANDGLTAAEERPRVKREPGRVLEMIGDLRTRTSDAAFDIDLRAERQFRDGVVRQVEVPKMSCLSRSSTGRRGRRLELIFSVRPHRKL